MSKMDSICLAMRAGSAAGWSIYKSEGSNRAIEIGLGTVARLGAKLVAAFSARFASDLINGKMERCSRPCAIPVSASAYARGIQSKPLKSLNRRKPTDDWIENQAALIHKPRMCHRLHLHPLARETPHYLSQLISYLISQS
jgi:hypothetical protein